MAIVLEDCTNEEQHPLVPFVGERLNAKDIHNEMFCVYAGNCLSRKAIYNWVTNILLMTKRLKLICGSG
jgi:hypothetical protein